MLRRVDSSSDANRADISHLIVEAKGVYSKESFGIDSDYGPCN